MFLLARDYEKAWSIMTSYITIPIKLLHWLWRRERRLQMLDLNACPLAHFHDKMKRVSCKLLACKLWLCFVFLVCFPQAILDQCMDSIYIYITGVTTPINGRNKMGFTGITTPSYNPYNTSLSLHIFIGQLLKSRRFPQKVMKNSSDLECQPGHDNSEEFQEFTTNQCHRVQHHYQRTWERCKRGWWCGGRWCSWNCWHHNC